MKERDADDPLDGTTWRKPDAMRSGQRTRIPCLTLCAHADPSRIGERSLLRGLIVRAPAELSRLAPRFALPGQEGGRALEDPYISRTPLRIGGDPRSGLELRYDSPRASADPSAADVRIDGAPLIGARALHAAELERGVLIELSGRALLLLHLCEGATPGEPRQLIGASDAIENVRREIERVAELAVPVLIRGETGSGKERVAQAIHERGARRKKPLVVTNVATLPPTTASSALFGHARGAFTGAAERHIGLFERADGGSLFLDEVGETPDEVQPMLLRTLETGAFTPLGDSRERTVDVRVIAATDADLERKVAHGRFRRALLHRLSAYEIHVPPLRERVEDIPRLFMHFLREELLAIGEPNFLRADAADPEPQVPAAFMAQLLRHALEGNARELRNLVRRLCAASRGQTQLVIEPQVERWLASGHAARASEPGGPPGPARKPSEIGDDELLAVLEANQWSPRRSALALNIPVSTLHDLMRKCPGIRKAKDIDDTELREQLAAAGGDIERMAAALRVSERALRITLRERGVLP
jgi:two-component system, NtrC family, nitrogen regulation response regulator GlnG